MNERDTDIRVRDATRRDAHAVARLIKELAASSRETSPVTGAYVEDYLARAASSVLLAESAGSVLGLLSYSVRRDLYHAGNSCLIEELVVNESARGRGVGSALLGELLSRLEAAGCTEVSVTVLPRNARAIKFYRRHGLTDEAVCLEKHFRKRGA